MIGEILSSVFGGLFGDKSSSSQQQQQASPLQPVPQYSIVGNMKTLPAYQSPMNAPAVAASQFGYKPASAITTPQAPSIGAPFSGDVGHFQHAFNQRKAAEDKATAGRDNTDAMMRNALFGIHQQYAKENPVYGGGYMLGGALADLFGSARGNGNTVEQELF